MATRRELTVISAKKKGTTALLTGAGTVLVSALLFKLFWLLGMAALVGGGYLTMKKVQEWLRFRGENGLYFK